MTHADWGSVWGAIGQWVGGVGTIAAVWTALYLARHEAREQAERYRRQELQAALEKSSLVLGETKSIPPSEADQTTPEWFVVISNHGPEPILLPRVENFVHPDGGSVEWEFDDPGSMWEEYVPPSSLPAGGSTRLPVAVRYDPEPQTFEWRAPVPIIAFTDSSGRRWRRVGSAPPAQVTQAEGPPPSGPGWYRA